PVQRKLVNLPPADHLARRSFFRLQLRRRLGNLYRLRGRARLERDIHQQRLRNLNRQVGLRCRRKAFRGDRNGVVPNADRCERVRTGCACVRLQGEALICIQQRHFRVRHHGAGGICDRAGYRSFIDLAKCELAWEQNEGCTQESDAEHGSLQTHSLCNAVTHHPNTLQCCRSYESISSLWNYLMKPKQTASSQGTITVN